MDETNILNKKEKISTLYYSKLTSKREAFINQLYNLINAQFEEQEKLKDLEPTKIIEELENNSDYIQRIFIDAPWGMGKTFFSKALKEKIEEENKNKENNKKISYININAWETDYFSDPMKSIIGELNSYNLINSETQTAIEEIMKNVFKVGGKFLLKLVLTKFNLKNEDIEQLRSLFNGVNTSELEDYKKYKELVDKFKECLSLEKDLKVIVIDELDRCKPSYAIELLETIKHFFGVKNIIFVFLVNKKQLQSIVSTSYLQDDECSEYFEKFFDIQFNLPKLEYEDFIRIEYDNYNQLETYGVDEQNISEDTTKIYESIFLDAFVSNCDSFIVSPRNFIKSFKKFKILLSSLSSEERACYPIMIVLILYFIREEFLNKNEKIELLFIKTFFIIKNMTLLSDIIKNLKDEDFFFEAKTKYKKNRDFYLAFFTILYLKKGGSYSGLYLEEWNNVKKINFILQNNKDIEFKEVLFDFNCILISSRTPEGYIYINPNLFNKKQLEIYRILNSCYNTNILEAWAEEKYNFTMNLK
ncbi:P-loop NTPase fold protein [Fusobacterium sp. SYSU M8D902]|uniref:KAP family P-loop NTPase fold protein n=1 Tax=Fusobacterium sp. SYSU M8D902 TaxID=3159562 RepID=UPI0032E403C7